jgi:hypothetical protein
MEIVQRSPAEHHIYAADDAKLRDLSPAKSRNRQTVEKPEGYLSQDEQIDCSHFQAGVRRE